MNKLLFVAAVFLAGCTAGEPTINTEAPADQTTHDGLFPIENSAFNQAWGDPDADWARYTKFIPGTAVFEFRAVKKTSSGSIARTSASNNEFWISDEDKQRLEDEVSAVFAEEMANSTRLALTDTPGSDVLVIRGALHDIVSNVPPEMVGRGEIFLSSVGEATIILEVVDSMSGEVLVRAVERRAAQRTGGQGLRANSVTTWAEVRRLARRWATRLREGMDNLPTE